MNEGALVEVVAAANYIADGDPRFKWDHRGDRLEWAAMARAAITAYRKHMGETA